MSKTGRTEFDLVLIYPFARKALIYLNIIKHLSSELRVGVYLTNIPKAEKHKELEEKFLTLCAEFGAELICDGIYSCKVALVALIGYQPDIFRKISREVQAEEFIGLVLIGTPISQERRAVIRRLKIKKVLVQDLDLLKIANPDLDQMSDLEFIETGLPYKTYPVFNKLDLPAIDYIVAFPTPLSTPTARSKVTYLTNTLRLLRQLQPGNNIYLKMHNVKAGATDSQFGIRGILASISMYCPEYVIRLLEYSVRNFAKLWRPIKWQKIDVLHHHFLYHLILKRVPLLNEVTKNHDLPLELFLPHISEGVITGRSSLVYGCLYSKIPVFNCDDEEKISSKPFSIDLYHNYCGVKPCYGELVFDVRLFQRITTTCRNGDLISTIRGLTLKNSAEYE